jgi:hypothetical protein
VRSFGCASSWDSPPGDFGVLVTGRGGGGGERWGRTLPERWESSPPRPEPRRWQRRQRLGRAPGGGGGCAAGGGGGRGPPPRQAAYERGDARRWDDRGCGSDHAGGGRNVRRAPEEEETGILHPEVGDHCPTRRIFETSEGLTFLLSRSQGGAHHAPLAPAKVLRSDAAVPTRRRSSRASRAAGSTGTEESEGSRGAAAALEPQQAATVAEPRRPSTAVEPQQAETVVEP